MIRPQSPEAEQSALDELRDASIENSFLKTFLGNDSAARALLINTMTLAPYLREIAIRNPASVAKTLQMQPEELLEEFVRDARNAWVEFPAEADLMRRLRQLKRDIAFSLALYDLGRVLESRLVTQWLSQFASAAVSSAIDHLLLAAHKAGKIVLRDLSTPNSGCGLAIIGMGKLGSGELNYSSDIDLVAIHDPTLAVVVDPDEATDVNARMVKRLIRIMQERTMDGYVFRTDLRIRPDPGSMPLSIPYDAAMHYYEGRGQNWERAAYIKASPIAGDLKMGANFCRDLTPFIFRKYLDYVAIADIHSIKRQIHAHKGFGEISAYGHNVKLGRGGIREIEFFVQTQQLIAGGRMPQIRTKQTEETLTALCQARWIGENTEHSLQKAYWFLRDVEHRIQMRNDEQSHILPSDEAEFRCIALMMGFDNAQEFADKLIATLRLVEKRYARLFENEAGLTSATGNLVFTGEQDDPDTIASLQKMGFARPSDMSRIIRTWHYGRYKATQTSKSRKLLTELMPQLLQAFADTRRADETLLNFDAFLAGLPAGMQLFSLLGSNSELLSLLVRIMASAPKLAEIIARNPHVFDGMLDPTLLADLPTRDYLSERLEAFLDGTSNYEEILDRLRIFASEQKFLVGVRLLTGAIDGERAARAFSHLADLTLRSVLDAAQIELERMHGRISGGRVAIIGLGKLGSLELTASSDVDVILLYAYDDGCEESDGAKPLDPVRYYTRLTQRLIAALSAPTGEGVLYEVDLRLRPSGNKGPVATNVRAFRKYQEEEAWVWEHMALSRARFIAGDGGLKCEAEAVFADVLNRKRDVFATAKEVAAMRQRIADEKPPANIWDLKLIDGGIIDIEFIAQFLRLQASAFGLTDVKTHTGTKEVIQELAPRMIGEQNAITLIETLSLLTNISQFVRLCLDEKFDPDTSPIAFQELMLNGIDFPDMARLEAHLVFVTGAVHGIFARTIQNVRLSH